MSYQGSVDTAKTISLSAALSELSAADGAQKEPGIPVRINFLRNFTVEGIEPFLKYHCLKSGLTPTVTFGNYDMMRQEVLDRGSHLYSSSPDLVVAALHLETYLPQGDTTAWSAPEVMQDLEGFFSDLAGNTDAVIAVNTFVPPFYSDYGITSTNQLPVHYHEVLRLNQLIREYVRDHASRLILVDWERLVRILGEDESMDYRFWYMSKAPFKKGFLDLYARELIKGARALKGKAKKCLVLDCDNTLWGGVVGEDGPQGIKLDRHSYPGNAFTSFQKSVLRLHRRGVLICLCSKNNEPDVFEVLDQNPQCLVKREHLSAWRVNWQDKACNLRELAQELNLGLDSFVFVDDNPVECGMIRDLIPEVTVLKVPEKLYAYPQLLDVDGLFDTLTLSAEDRERSRMYQQEASRKSEQGKFVSVEEYLSSLELSITVHPARGDELPRVAQLTQKTNQFNLTTRRYSPPQIESFAADANWSMISLHVRDRFGDLGLTGVFMARREGGIGYIDTYLMSCRIIGRNIEVAFLLKALEITERLWEIDSWRAEYLPTKKNQQVANFWPTLGFTELEKNEEGNALYVLEKSATRPDPISYIAIEEE